jgi:hypothetical protein
MNAKAKKITRNVGMFANPTATISRWVVEMGGIDSNAEYETQAEAEEKAAQVNSICQALGIDDPSEWYTNTLQN